MIVGLTASLFVNLLCGVSLAVAIRDPDPPALIVLVLSCFLILGPLGLWVSAYALWVSDRSEVEVDDLGVRLKSALYRHIPWADVAGLGTALSMGQEVGPCVFLTEGRGVRTLVWPFRTQRVVLGMQGDRLSVNEVVEIIRSHPNYRGKAFTL